LEAVYHIAVFQICSNLCRMYGANIFCFSFCERTVLFRSLIRSIVWHAKLES